MPEKEDFAILPSELVRIPLELRRKVLHLNAEVVLLNSRVEDLASSLRCTEFDLSEAIRTPTPSPLSTIKHVSFVDPVERDYGTGYRFMVTTTDRDWDKKVMG